mgnify:CR=1 FL=1
MQLIDKKYNFLKPIKTPNLIRFGGKLDGGYVVDFEIIKKCNNLITLGLGPNWSFELDYLSKNKKNKVHIYDHTVSSYPYIKAIGKYFRRLITFRTTFEGFTTRVKNFYNYKKFLYSKNVNFFKEKIAHTIKNKIDTDIEKVFSRINSQEEVVLKIDIEGSEYEVVDQILKYSNRIQMLIFEFHWIDKKEEIFLESIKKLKDYFEIIHIHGNNHYPKLNSGLPIILEITFLNKKYIGGQKVEYINKFPVKGLDYPCNPYKEDLTFSFE